MKRTILWTIIALLLTPFATRAQTPAPVVVPRGQTFNVEFNSQYPNDGLIRFWIQVDTSTTKTFTQAELTVTASQPLADCFGTTTPPTGAQCFLYRGLHPSLNNLGTRSMRVYALEVASGLSSGPSPTLSFIVGTAPNAPNNPKIIVTTTQAGVTFEFRSAPVTVTTPTTASATPTTTVRIPVR